MKGKAVRAISGEAQPSVREMNGCYQAVEGNQAFYADERVGEVLGRPLEEPKASEAKYQQLLDDINEGYLMVTLAGKIVFVNNKMAEILTYKPKELVGRAARKFSPSELIPYIIAIGRKMEQRRGYLECFETTLWNNDGNSMPVEVSAKLCEYQGEPAIAAIVRDITERKKAEEALRQSERKYSSVVELSADGIVLVQGGEIIFANRSFYELLGFEASEIIGIDILSLISGDMADAVSVMSWDERQMIMRRVSDEMKGHHSHQIYQVPLKTKSGETVWVEIHSNPIEYEGKAAHLAFLRDVTERKRVEEEILRHTRRLEALHAVAQTVSQSLDMEEMLDRVVEKVMEVMDTDAATISVVDEVGGEAILKAHRGLSEEFVASVGRLKLESEEIERILGWRRPSIANEEVFGQHNIVKLRAAAVREGLQSSLAVPLLTRRLFIGSVSVACRHRREFTSDDVDLLSSIANQIAVGIHNAQLFEGAQARVEELKAAQQIMVQTERHKALAEMAAGVAHDFNNVLSIVLGRAELALEDVKQPKVKESLQIIEQSACDAGKMVHRLQAFAGATVGEELETLDLNQVVKSALQMVETRRAESQLRGVEIDISADLGEVSTVEGNPAQLREVLVNIVFNAMDALPQGGRISIETGQEDSWIVVSISDTGIGMTDEVKKRIFDPFFTTKGSQGSGLGLSASHGIITKHGGSIEVDSILGEGSTFYIRLPIFNGTRIKARRG